MSQRSAVEQTEAREQVVAELDAWRRRSMPSDAPLEADDVAHLVRTGFASLGIDADVGADFSVNTVHYYRRKDILDAPAGRTSSARYDVRHVWQAMGARLAGQLGLVTLAEARKALRGADEETLKAFVAMRVLDARARVSLRSPQMRARPLPGVISTREEGSRTRDEGGGKREAGRATREARGQPNARLIQLPGDAWCIIPNSHAANNSPAAARELVDALASALGVG
jgi:hypothetical protein